MNPTYEPYSTKQEALDRLNALACELRGKGFMEESRDIFFQFQKKEMVVFDKTKWHYDGEFPQELDIFQCPDRHVRGLGSQKRFVQQADSQKRRIRYRACQTG